VKITNGFAETNKLYLDIHHVNSGRNVTFKAFLTNYSEEFNTSYDEQFFVMNQQPVRKLKSTIRTINISWVLPAYDIIEADRNLGKISLLSNMLYPEQVRGAGVGGGFYPKVGGSPIFKLRLVNWVRDASPSSVDSYSIASNSGMLGYIDGFNYSFVMEEGFFLVKGKALPKNIEASFSYLPVNEKSPAWINKKFNYPGYPYKEGHLLHKVPDLGEMGDAYSETSEIYKNAAGKLIK